MELGGGILAAFTALGSKTFEEITVNNTVTGCTGQ
jgi:hypothetical protein